MWSDQWLWQCQWLRCRKATLRPFIHRTFLAPRQFTNDFIFIYDFIIWFHMIASWKAFFKSQYAIWGLGFEAFEPARLSAVFGMARGQNLLQTHAEAWNRHRRSINDQGFIKKSWDLDRFGNLVCYISRTVRDYANIKGFHELWQTMHIIECRRWYGTWIHATCQTLNGSKLFPPASVRQCCVLEMRSLKWWSLLEVWRQLQNQLHGRRSGQQG